MPGLSGVDLFRKIKADHPSVPVILMTGFAVEQQIEAAVSEGVFAVLSKPFDVADATGTLERALRCPVVLVIDDVERDARSTVEALESSGLRAVAAPGADESATGNRGGRGGCLCDRLKARRARRFRRSGPHPFGRPGDNRDCRGESRSAAGRYARGGLPRRLPLDAQADTDGRARSHDRTSSRRWCLTSNFRALDGSCKGKTSRSYALERAAVAEQEASVIRHDSATVSQQWKMLAPLYERRRKRSLGNPTCALVPSLFSSPRSRRERPRYLGKSLKERKEPHSLAG